MSTHSTQPQELRVHGLDCAEEVAILKRALADRVGGEENLGFDVLRGKMTVHPGAGAIDQEAVVAAVAATGMRAEPWAAEPAPGTRRRSWLRDASVTVSGLAILAGFALHAARSGILAALAGGVADAPIATPLLYALAIAAGAWFVLPKAWHAARTLRPDMNLLMVVAISGAVGIGEWFEAATVAFLFGLSLLLESWSVGRARRAVEALLDLAPPTARVRGEDGGERQVAAGDVAPGTVFVVHPGERIPLDGEVVEGIGEVDQAPITGESAPRVKEPGDTVYAGTINGTGVLVTRTTREADRTTLAGIIRRIEEARSRRSPTERWVDRFARRYTPAVLALAAGVLLLPPLAFGGDWVTWLYRALVLLVIACPCALVLSTPVSVVSALASAARQGVLIKGGDTLEAPAGLKAVAWDKTGTLTRGEFEVVEVVALDRGSGEEGVLRRAAALEARQHHPLARAVVTEARRRGLPVEAAADARSLPGRGAIGRLDGAEWWIGSRRFAEERTRSREGQDGREGSFGGANASDGVDTTGCFLGREIERRMNELGRSGRTVVALGDERGVRGLVAVADQVRPRATEAVAHLRSLGVGYQVMLTGDRPPAAETVARHLGLDEVVADLLPQDKEAAVARLVERHGQVAMVGDGVNDAPALARASLGIAMGAAGSDAAVETADVALMADDPQRVAWLVEHSRRALRVIRQNVAFALGAKLAVFLFAVTGGATLWMAIAADMGASLAVIANGLRLLRVPAETPGSR